MQLLSDTKAWRVVILYAIVWFAIDIGIRYLLVGLYITYFGTVGLQLSYQHKFNEAGMYVIL